VRVVIAPDKLKGTYSADEAAQALARGWGARRQDDLRLVPLAEIPGLVSGGTIRHSLVVVALYYFDLWQRNQSL
jgi:hypothetical protein